ncbi:tetratricopeptide repeat protein [Streptacidiphilus cavernicola]|uniref:Tetratricopeptide repeat protein n=1 Tax=Streptacidiphilus cavernicola TaxID=3342716 RepID=A0ABV6VZG6_9ACTN
MTERLPPQVSQDVTATAGYAYATIGADILLTRDGMPLYLLEAWRPSPSADPGWLRELPSRMLNSRFAVVRFTGRERELATLRAWRDGDQGPEADVEAGAGIRTDGAADAGPGSDGAASAGAAADARAGGPAAASADVGMAGATDASADTATAAGTAAPTPTPTPTPTPAEATSARWLHAPGGQGKTRLAAEFAAQSAAAGWTVVTATHALGTVLGRPGSHDLRTAGTTGLLVIVDYADRWPRTHLLALLTNTLIRRGAIPTRILLLARTADALPGLDAALAEYGISVSEHLLTPLPDRPGYRDAMFRAARDAFADCYGTVDPTAVQPPGPLDHPDLGLTLAIQMTALVAVDAHASGRRPPSGTADLTLYLLDRERKHWELLHTRATRTTNPATSANTTGPSAAPTPRAYSTPSPVMNRAVFVATLTGAVPRATGAALLTGATPGPDSNPNPDPSSDPNPVLDDHAFCYPPADRTTGSVLEPLYPDRLAEDFVALTVPEHSAAYPAQPWAAPTATAVLARRGDDRAAAPWTGRTVLLLAAAAERWPHLGPACLYPLLADDPQLALDAGSAALSALAAVPDVDPAVLEAVDARCPLSRQLDLDIGIEAVTLRLTKHQLTLTEDPETRAGLYQRLAMRQHFAARYDDSHANTLRALDLLRPLADADPGRFDADLAGCLGLLSTNLSALGAQDEALQPAKEAEELWRRLAEADTERHQADHGQALQLFGAQLAQAGGAEAAARVTRRAVDVWRTAARSDDPYDRAGLARSLHNLSAVLSRLGEVGDALAAEEEALALLRRLAESAPARYEPDLARSLMNRAVVLSDAGQWQEASAIAREAVEILRRLVRINPALFEPSLAGALTNLAGVLGRTGAHEEALACAEEAVATAREYAAVHPAAHEPALAAALNALAVRLADRGRYEPAVAAGEEAVRITRRLNARSRSAFQAGLAHSLGNLAPWLGRLGRNDEAFAAAEESVEHYRLCAATSPDEYEPALAWALTGLGGQLTHAGRRQQAVAATEEAVRLLRGLADRHPALFASHLADALHNLGVLLGRTDPDRALAPAEEAASIRRRLAPARPGSALRKTAEADLSLGNRLSALRRPGEALPHLERAVAAYRELAADTPAAFESHLADGLNDLAPVLAELGRPEQALSTLRESVRLFRALAAAEPGAQEPQLARTLANLGSMLTDQGLQWDALTAAEEALSVRRRVVEREPGRYESDLADDLWLVSFALVQLSRYDDAVTISQESVAVLRRLAEEDPDGAAPELANALVRLCGVLRKAKRRREAFAAAREAERIRWEIRLSRLGAQARAPRPASFPAEAPALARRMLKASKELSWIGEPDKALHLAQEALHWREAMAAAEPALYAPELAEAQYHLGRLLHAAGRHQDAIAVFERAAGTFRGLERRHPDADRLGVATSLVASAWSRLLRGDDLARSRDEFAEAAKLFQALAEADPERYAESHRSVLAIHADLTALLRSRTLPPTDDNEAGSGGR